MIPILSLILNYSQSFHLFQITSIIPIIHIQSKFSKLSFFISD